MKIIKQIICFNTYNKCTHIDLYDMKIIKQIICARTYIKVPKQIYPIFNIICFNTYNKCTHIDLYDMKIIKQIICAHTYIKVLKQIYPIFNIICFSTYILLFNTFVKVSNNKKPPPYINLYENKVINYVYTHRKTRRYPFR